MEAGRAALQESNAVEGRLRPHLQPGELIDPHVDPHTALYAPPYDNIRDIPNTAALDMQRKELEEAEKLAETQATLQNAQYDEMRDDWKDAQQQAKEQAELREKEKAEQRASREKHEEAMNAQRDKQRADQDAKKNKAGPDQDAKNKKEIKEVRGLTWMAVVKILAFGGMIPVTDDRLLADFGCGSSHVIAYLYDGRVVGMVSPKYIRDMANPDYAQGFPYPQELLRR